MLNGLMVAVLTVEAFEEDTLTEVLLELLPELFETIELLTSALLSSLVLVTSETALSILEPTSDPLVAGSIGF